MLRVASAAVRSASAAVTAAAKPPTAVVMLNMGGPRKAEDTESFLLRLFNDREIVQMGPLQPWLVSMTVSHPSVDRFPRRAAE
jgi:protoheme ferro-lyase